LGTEGRGKELCDLILSEQCLSESSI